MSLKTASPVWKGRLLRAVERTIRKIRMRFVRFMGDCLFLIIEKGYWGVKKLPSLTSGRMGDADFAFYRKHDNIDPA